MNATDPGAQSVHGVNPQSLVEKIMRNRIYSNVYWKEQCFGLTAETLVDKAVELTEFGGTFGGNQQPTHFLCLLLKMLQLQPELEVVKQFIENEDYKYVHRQSDRGGLLAACWPVASVLDHRMELIRRVAWVCGCADT